MPKRKRTQKRSDAPGRQLTSSQLMNLCCGWDYFGDAFGNDLQAMYDAYRAHRAEVIAFPQRRPGTEAWAYRVFDLSINRDAAYGTLKDDATLEERQQESAAKIAAWDSLKKT